MQLNHFKTIIPAENREVKILCLVWSPNNKKLAVCNNQKNIILYDENGERRARFSAKNTDSNENNIFQVNNMAFSYDSTKLAISQTDNVIFVYKLGDNWDDKKSICNKFPQKNMITSLIWLMGQFVICGLSDGKVRLANIKENKSYTLYNATSHVVSLASNTTGRGFISGHLNGNIIYYLFDNKENENQGKVATHPTAPYALVWAGSTILAAGSDKRIYVYDRSGKIVQQFDFNRCEFEKEFLSVACSPSGQAVAFGSFNRIRIFSWSPRKCGWDESKTKEIKNIYSITSMSWKPDGSKLAIGTICGAVELFDCCMKKKIYKRIFELNFVEPSHVIVKNTKSGKSYILKSNFGYEIDDVKVLNKNQFLVAYTSNTIIISDVKRNKFSEVNWKTKNQKESFYFGYDNLCLIFRAGEVTVIELGENKILGSVRTEFTTPYLISVRINADNNENISKKLAYMLDLKTVVILDFSTGVNIAQVTHDKKIDWIELNNNGSKLLFRDKKLQLLLFNVEKNCKCILLNFCTYVQWVPNTDIIVAQSKDDLCIWYNIDTIDKINTIALKGGEVIDIVSHQGKSEVVVKEEGAKTVNYPLDVEIIEFGLAMEQKNFERAILFVRNAPNTTETKSMWIRLAKMAIKYGNLFIAEECYATLGCVSKVRYLQNIKKMKTENKLQNFNTQAQIAIMNKDLKLAENIYLSHNAVNCVIKMYANFLKWDEAIEIAEARAWPELEDLKQKYHSWLTESGYNEKSAELRCKAGDIVSAINLFLRALKPGKAARLILADTRLCSDHALVDKVIQALIQSELFEKAGDLYHQTGGLENAMRCYRQGNNYQKAIDLARVSFPSNVVRLEEEWGNYLVSQHQLDSAIQHFIEAGAYVKAADAAINARQWIKASHILDSIENKNSAHCLTPYYAKLGQHYVTCHEYELAESAFLKANEPKLAIEMYNGAGLWEKAHVIASNTMDHAELIDMYLTQAQEFENKNNYKDAERLYLTLRQPTKAIAMYKRVRQYRDMLRLVKTHNADLFEATCKQLAKELESEENLKQAEQYYIQANDWKSAINMYRTRDCWEKAYQVASMCTADQPKLRKQVAYFWAKHLGGDAAHKLLTRLGQLESGLDCAMEHGAFEFALGLAYVGCKERLVEIHNKYAIYLEDEGKYFEAETQFIRAGKPREAVLMYIQRHDWDSASRVANDHDPDSLAAVQIEQANVAFSNRDYAKAEALLLRAHRADILIRAYQEVGMWEDALRVAETYLPDRLQELKDNLIQKQMHSDSAIHPGLESTSDDVSCRNNADSSQEIELLKAYLVQAKEFESRNDYIQAVDMYLKIRPNDDDSANANLCEHYWLHAVNLAVKFFETDSSVKVTELVASRLISIKRFVLAGELLLSINKIYKAVDAFIEGGVWEKAKEIAYNMKPELQNYIEEKYKESLKNSKQIETLASVDVNLALDMYAEKGRWEKCLKTAEQQLIATYGKLSDSLMMTTDYQRLHKYVAIYAAELIKDLRVSDALALYCKYGTPVFKQNFNIYKRIFQDITNQRELENPDCFKTWSSLRNMLWNLNKNLATATDISDEIVNIFEKMLMVAHYCTTRCALQLSSYNAKEIIAKISVSLLRHSDILPADKLFYQAGINCRELGWNSMASMFLNRFLDLVDAITNSDLSALEFDDTGFKLTDIPMEVSIPETLYTNDAQLHDVKSWILNYSLDRKCDESLPIDERGVYVASLKSPNNNVMSLPCVITGYPVLRSGIQFQSSKMLANAADWDKFNQIAKISKSNECVDVKSFITEWCGQPIGN